MRAQRTAKSVSAKKHVSLNAKSKYPDSRSEINKHFGLLLTDAQIEKYAARHPVVKRDVAEDIFETFDRDFFIAIVVEDVLGKEYWWPTNGDQDAYKNFFYPVFYNAAIMKGIGITPAAKRIASMYNQLVVTVPEKLGKKIAKAVRKKFDIHCIEGGTCITTEGTTVQVLASNVNATLLTIVQVWAEGYLEGAE